MSCTGCTVVLTSLPVKSYRTPKDVTLRPLQEMEKFRHGVIEHVDYVYFLVVNLANRSDKNYVQSTKHVFRSIYLPPTGMLTTCPLSFRRVMFTLDDRYRPLNAGAKFVCLGGGLESSLTKNTRP
jgi:hypothetical protein